MSLYKKCPASAIQSERSISESTPWCVNYRKLIYSCTVADISRKRWGEARGCQHEQIWFKKTKKQKFKVLLSFTANKLLGKPPCQVEVCVLDVECQRGFPLPSRIGEKDVMVMKQTCCSHLRHFTIDLDNWCLLCSPPPPHSLSLQVCHSSWTWQEARKTGER